MRNALRNNDRVLYKQKRRHGISVTLSYITGKTENFETGKVTNTFATLFINKAIVMPIKEGVEQTSPRSFNFDFGGFVDHQKVTVYIDKNDLGSVVLTNEMRIIILGETYGISGSDLSLDKTGYIINCYRIKNQ